jgi:methionyl-tRNA synthetase
MPETSRKIQLQIGVPSTLCKWESVLAWGSLPLNKKITKAEPLFPRIDVKKEMEELSNISEDSGNENVSADGVAAEATSTAVAPNIDIKAFSDVDLRVVKVDKCEPVEGSKKLLKLTVYDGIAQRTIMSGIAKYYSPDELIGRNVVIVSNLKPVKLCSVESQGMVLAADCDDSGVKLIFADDVVVGSRVR